MVMFPFYCSFDDKHEREEVDGYVSFLLFF